MKNEIKDPSDNVKNSLFSEVKRLDDLMTAKLSELQTKLECEIKRIDEKIKLQSESSVRFVRLSNSNTFSLEKWELVKTKQFDLF